MKNIVDFTVCGHSARFLHLPKSGAESLVFLMGSLQEIESVSAFNQGFSASYDYWAIELPGSGNSAPLHPRYPVSFLAECLSEVHTRFIGRPFHLVACSYATGIALEYARRWQEVLHRMVLAGSMSDIPLSEWPVMLQLMRDCAYDTEAFAEGFIALLSESHPSILRQPAIRRAATRKARHYREDNFWHFVFNTIRLMTYHPGELGCIQTPTLVFTGEHDPYVKPERAKALADSLACGHFQTVAGCDHLFHIQKPEETLQLMQAFLSARELGAQFAA